MTKLHELAILGQSVWLDYISRSLFTSGELVKLVRQGLGGMTSNPTIFDNAISKSADYDDDLHLLVEEGKPVEKIFEALAMKDICMAADVLRPVFDRTGGEDGYVSLEVSPKLANDTENTLLEATRLFAEVQRPNLMIKIPATPAGIPAIEAATSRGINVNVTLIFSLAQYEAAAKAYIAGLEKLAASGGDVSRVASVASFFVSRVDTLADKELQAIGETELQGKIAIANAKVAYACFKEYFSGERWHKLAAKGARVQRPLWASTGTKNPAYPDTLYVDNLIGPHTVNTIPPATLQAYLDHGQAALTVETGIDLARFQLTRLAELGISLDAITHKLLEEGVAAFNKSFESLMASISTKRDQFLASHKAISAELGGYRAAVQAALAEMEAARVAPRIWAGDYTIWKPEPTEIANRLGWLHIAEALQKDITRLEALTQEVRAAGYTQALLLGMGGSSLAPEVFRKIFGVRQGYLNLAVLDSTDPGAVLAYAERLDLAKTLFIVSTKSGGTVETLSFFKYFYNRLAETLDSAQVGAHFIAITDPGSSLTELAKRYQFRSIFLNDPDIGGRYSALSHFGMVPAALTGVDLTTLFKRAVKMAETCQVSTRLADGDNPGAFLGAVLGVLARAGRDKVTWISSPSLCSFSDWVEQLIAESTGKEGKGILPVVGESVGAPEVYGADRTFIYLRLDGEAVHDAAVLALQYAGHPVVRVEMYDLYDLGGQFFLWEMATAVAGSRLGINPFDQPNVEAAKVLARQMMAAYQKEGKLPEPAPTLQTGEIVVYADFEADTLTEAFNNLLKQAKPGAYLAIQAYIQPTEEADASLLALRTRLRELTQLAVTSGYGPRFLHSTGQLHKGDGGLGLFIQLTSDAHKDADIPDQAGEGASSISFGTLKLAQALGDRQALLKAGRKVLRFHLGSEALTNLARLQQALA